MALLISFVFLQSWYSLLAKCYAKRKSSQLNYHNWALAAGWYWRRARYITLGLVLGSSPGLFQAVGAGVATTAVLSHALNAPDFIQLCTELLHKALSPCVGYLRVRLVIVGPNGSRRASSTTKKSSFDMLKVGEIRSGKCLLAIAIRCSCCCCYDPSCHLPWCCCSCCKCCPRCLVAGEGA